MSHPPGHVVVCTNDLSRYADFTVALVSTLTPPGSRLIWTRGIGIAENVNRAFRTFLNEKDKQWVWLLGDDHSWKPDTLMRLLEHNLDIVTPLVSRRKPPLAPVIFSQESTPGRYKTLNWNDLPPGGLLEVVAAGTAGMLIRRPVIERMLDPWMEVGQTTTEALGEDLHFCKKARELGYRLYVDLDVTMAHMTPMHIWPYLHNGKWTVQIDIDNGFRITFDPLMGEGHVGEVHDDGAAPR